MKGYLVCCIHIYGGMGQQRVQQLRADERQVLLGHARPIFRHV